VLRGTSEGLAEREAGSVWEKKRRKKYFYKVNKLILLLFFKVTKATIDGN